MWAPSAEDAAFFEQFGYLHVRGLLSPVEMDTVSREFESMMRVPCEAAFDAKFVRGFEAGPEDRVHLLGGIQHSEALSRWLLTDRRVVDLISLALGDDFSYTGGDGNYYNTDTTWHADSSTSQWEVAGGELFSAKLSFYIDPLGPDTGALRVLPGSHRADHWARAAPEPEGGPSLLNRSAEVWGVEPQDVPGAVSLATEPGDAIM